MTRFDTRSFGAPTRPHKHHRIRQVISLVAATSGAVAVLVVGFIIVSWSGPGEATWAWILLLILVLVFLSGFWWRWDSPDIRNPGNERSRRGF
jgi:O-antigen/teichoic acid export membrane protein